MLALAAMIVRSIAAISPGIATVAPPAVVMAGECTLVRTGAAVVGPLPITPLAIVSSVRSVPMVAAAAVLPHGPAMMTIAVMLGPGPVAMTLPAMLSHRPSVVRFAAAMVGRGPLVASRAPLAPPLNSPVSAMLAFAIRRLVVRPRVAPA